MLRRNRLLVVFVAWVIATATSVATAAETPNASFTVEQFHELVTADNVAAKQKHGDKVIELTGTISGMSAYSDSVALVLFDGHKAGCYVNDPQPWRVFGVGQKVRVRGTYTRRLIGVGLERCTLTAIDDSPLIHRAAEQLAAEFHRNLDTATDTYDNQQLVVTGKVAEIEHDESGPTEIFLEGVEGVRISCAFAYGLERRLRDVEVGQQFICYGEFLRLLAKKDEVGLIGCLPIEPPPEPKEKPPADPFAGWSADKARTWTNRAGKTVAAEFVSVNENTVRLKRKADGKIFDIPLDALSDADQTYARGQGTVVIPKLAQPLADAQESDAYTLVRLPKNAAAIVTTTNALLDRAGGLSHVPAEAKTLDEVLTAMDGVIANVEKIGMTWSREKWFDPREKVFATALKNHHQGKEYHFFMYSNSPEFTHGVVVIYPDRVYRRDQWLVVPLPKK